MSSSPTGQESEIVELAVDAFEAFCEDIGGMFEVDMSCEEQGVSVETVKGLKKRFKKLCAVNTVRAEGLLDGKFQLLFDQGGLFTLAGVIVMLPEDRIVDQIKRGSIEDVESMNDAIGEVGNLLVGAWDRVFREQLEEHGHFLQYKSFIGKPWDKPEEKIDMPSEEELVFAGFEMTVEPYPTFKCGAAFPKSLFGADSSTVSDSGAEQPKVTADKSKEDNEAVPESSEGNSEHQKATEASKEAAAESRENSNPVPAEEPSATAESAGAEETKKNPEEPAEAEGKETPEAVESETTQTGPEPMGMVSKAIQKMTAKEDESAERGQEDHPTVVSESFDVCKVEAADIMNAEVVWIDPDDSVQQVFSQMQQQNVGYALVGRDNIMEGIVSSSDISAAMSPYLRPTFARWRRPLDDATLQIKVRWIMSKPVRSVVPDATVQVMTETMRRFKCRALPVIDSSGTVLGLVTTFDIFKVFEPGACRRVSGTVGTS